MEFFLVAVESGEELLFGGLEVFGQVVEDLGAGEGGGFGPSALGGGGGFDGIADVFAVRESELLTDDLVGVSTVGAGLFASDVELVGAVDLGFDFGERLFGFRIGWRNPF